MKRGEIWTVSGAKGYASKPRPSLILQADGFGGTQSITICGFTTCEDESPFRIQIEPDIQNGISKKSSIMIDKITTIRKNAVGKRIGRLSTSDMVRVNRAVFRFLGLAFPLDDGHP